MHPLCTDIRCMHACIIPTIISPTPEKTGLSIYLWLYCCALRDHIHQYCVDVYSRNHWCAHRWYITAFSICIGNMHYTVHTYMATHYTPQMAYNGGRDGGGERDTQTGSLIYDASTALKMFQSIHHACKVSWSLRHRQMAVCACMQWIWSCIVHFLCMIDNHISKHYVAFACAFGVHAAHMSVVSVRRMI